MTLLSRAGVARSVLALSLVAASAATVHAQSSAEDPYLWLEEIEGARAIQQVDAWNAETDKVIRATPGFESDRQKARDILDDESQIAMPDEVMGDRITNLWRDAEHPRGLWRSSPLDAYLAGKPEWTTLIDVDALVKQEGQSWVWHGANCLAPDYKRCLVSLSPGGTDADVVREWDMASKSFVKGGFELPAAKSNVGWIDADHLLVGTDFGEGSMTDSGYPRILKEWTRGTPLSSAKLALVGEKADVSLSPGVLTDAGHRWVIASRATDFYNGIAYLRGPDGRYARLGIPESADIRGVLDGRLIVFLNKPLGSFKAGSIVSWALEDLAAGKAGGPEMVFTPSKTQAFEQIGTTDHYLWIKVLDDVQGKLLRLSRAANGKWTSTAVPLAENATVSLAGGADKRDLAFVTVATMLDPTTLMAVPATGAPTKVQSLPARFDASKFKVEQHFAKSKDGTRVPYFLVRRKDVKGPVPVLMFGYGGFRNAITPSYLTGEPYRASPVALWWAEEGNAYVLANIRGGGEYGPNWHESALREHRQRAYDDLTAISEDLIRTGVTQKKKIAFYGRSNGGLLAGVAMTQRPDLYGAIVIGSPLEDMKRYSHLLAGASWMAEYGDPDVPGDWAFISKYSPYQNVKPGVKYPPVFMYLSTKDDRVHPGHARKLTARLMEYGNPVFYHEYREGGHSVGADHAEDAVRAAMLHAFLKKELMGEGK